MYINNNLNVNGNITSTANLNVYNVICSKNISNLSTMTISGSAYLYGDSTILSLFNSNNNYCNSISFLSNLNVSYISPLTNSVSILNNLNISGIANINGSISINSNINISNNTILQNTTCLSSLYISGNSNINSNIYNSLIVTGNSNINNLTNLSNLDVEGNIVINNSINNNITLFNSLNISGYTTINNINILGQLINNLPEYPDNDSATTGGVPLWGFYRTGGIIKIRINSLISVLVLNGTSTINLYLNDIFIDPGATLTNSLNYTISTIGTVTTQQVGSYIVYYNALDSNNNIINTLSRIINVIAYPIIVNITLISKQIIVTISGTFNIMTYYVTNNNNNIISETQIFNNNIDVSYLPSNSIPYIITINLKRNDGTLLTSNSLNFIL